MRGPVLPVTIRTGDVAVKHVVLYAKLEQFRYTAACIMEYQYLSTFSGLIASSHQFPESLFKAPGFSPCVDNGGRQLKPWA